MADSADGDVYAVVSNVPSCYHSSHLRNYFSQFIETSGFKCFHFRHRPQIREFDLNAKLPLRLNPSSESSVLDSNRRTCCIVLLKESRLQELFNCYNKKHWLDTNGDSLPLKCFINTVKIKHSQSENQSTNYKTRSESRQMCSGQSQLEVSTGDLQKFQELHPPPAMPNGNVGTPTTVFLELIRTCRLPSKIIGKLGLEFPRNKAKRMYGSVPYNYGGKCKNKYIPEEEEIIRTRSGVILSTNMSVLSSDHQSVPCNAEEIIEENDSSSDDDDDFCEEWERHEAFHNDVTQQERCKERLFEEEIELKWEKGGSGLVFYTDAQYWDELEGDFDAKTSDDWDVDMSIYYDPTAGDKDARDMMQMRQETKLRNGRDNSKLESSNNASISSPNTDVFEELPEQDSTAKPNQLTGTAHNSKTVIKNSRRSRLKEQLPKFKFGGFEHHTKGIGRRVLERQGWKEGQGLGKSIAGISEPIEDWGQRPWDKKGLGFRGEKLVRQVREKKRHGRRKGHVGTIYDDPGITDPPVPVTRSDFHTRLSYRQEFIKGKSTLLT